MARCMNRVQLIGFLGQDAELRATGTNDPVLTFTLATTETWKDAKNQKQSRTEWHKIVVFGYQAEFLSKVIKKGSLVMVEGKLQTRKWSDNAGQDRWSTEIVVNNAVGNVNPLDRKPADDNNNNNNTSDNSNDFGEYQDYFQGNQGGN